MAGRGNPSFQKNQKARKRQERAAAKRAARQARRDERAQRASGEGAPLDDSLRREALGLPEEEESEGIEDALDSDEAPDEADAER